MEPYNKPRLWKRIGQWTRRHRRLSFVAAGIIIILISVATAIIIYNKTTPAKVVAKVIVTKPVPKPVPVVYYSPLTGNIVPDLAATTQPVTAIMIENSPDARPQSGMKQAGVVFEAIAEGGITRFLTIHQEDKPQLIGPVRSVRMYFVDWLAAFNASVAHVGGSAAALTEVRNGNYRDIDEFFNGDSYWRATDRYAPHNVYTTFAKLDALNAAKGYTTSHFTGFTRTDGKASAAPDATSIAINFSGPLYNTTYTYDKTTNSYLRFEGGEPHLDREAGQLTPSVVIAMHVDESTILQDGYREDITTIGSGKATIFQNGMAIDATWTKTSKTSQITFADATGKDIPLVRGQTWIAAIPNNGGSVSWQ